MKIFKQILTTLAVILVIFAMLLMGTAVLGWIAWGVMAAAMAVDIPVWGIVVILEIVAVMLGILSEVAAVKMKIQQKEGRETMKKGDKVQIIGDVSDFTNHLHGMIGIIVSVRENDSLVKVNDDVYWCWNYNLKYVEK